jgi:hypothetical protein
MSEKVIPEVDYTKLKWTCTDPDNFQYGRKISDGVYQFKEFDRLSENEVFGKLKAMSYDRARGIVEENFNVPRYWEEDTIVLANFSKEAIAGHISAYYDSVEQVHEIYGDDAEWIIAECIFEQQSGLY